jgi:hypothetical protein
MIHLVTNRQRVAPVVTAERRVCEELSAKSRRQGDLTDILRLFHRQGENSRLSTGVYEQDFFATVNKARVGNGLFIVVERQ